jgi:hypothetical protein
VKIVKSVKFHVISGVVSYKSGLIYKILRGINTFLCGAFVYPYGGLGGPPSSSIFNKVSFYIKS